MIRVGVSRSQNHILHAKSDTFFWEGNGSVSIKTFSNGKAFYSVNKGFFAVDEQKYLLLNEGSYKINIESETEVESFCLFFRDGFAEEVYRTLTDSSEGLLSDPSKPKTSSISFFEKTYGMDENIRLLLNRFKKNFAESDPLWREEQFHHIMTVLLEVQLNTAKEIDRLPGLRSSTREELFRRIHYAHDFIDAYFDQPLTLDEMADVACLSTNHLLRNYSEYFGLSPYQHMTEKRMEKARQLLKETDDSITDIAFKVGFQTPSSFTKRFTGLVGESPREYRKKVILEKK